MRHELFPTWKERVSVPRWSVDAAPRVRLAMLFLVFLLPILGIASRLMWLQVVIPDRYLSTWNQTTESFETISAADGRILTSDGLVLAYDQPRYSVYVHYRWLEDPVNPDWLRTRARETLSRAERQNLDRVKDAEQQLLRQRERMWSSLAEFTGRSQQTLTEKRQETQRRVEAIVQSVNTRRQAKAREVSQGSPDDTLLDRLWRELSTPPDRNASRPIVLKEELDVHPVVENITVEQMAAMEALPSRFPGIEIRSSTERIYPRGSLAAHVIGLRAPVDDDEIKRRKDRFPQGDPLALEHGDRQGQSGIERAYDSRLRGVRGLRRVVRNHGGEIIEQQVIRAPRLGADVVLTLDADLQNHAEQLLDAALSGKPVDDSTEITPDGSQAPVTPTAGAVVVLDLRSGETLIAASSPRFDLEAMRHPTRSQWNSWAQDPRHPFLSRVTQATVPPGSLFKIVTAIAGLEQGILDPAAAFHCQGYLNDPQHDRCYIYRHFGHGHGNVTLSMALSQSCNVYFFDLAERVGPQPIETWARQLGFGVPTGIDIGGERAGNVPSRTAKTQGSRWYPGTTRQFAIGQADLTVTPLQVTQLMAVIGNGGRLVTPRFTTSESESEPQETSSRHIQQASAESPAKSSTKLLSERTLQVIREGLELTVEHPRGTGHKAQVPGLLIAGKTGTAEVGGDQPDHAWFAGYVPADRPRYAFTVFLEHGGSGGKAAAPIARQIIMSMVEADLLSPKR